MGDFVVWLRAQWDRIAGSLLIAAGVVVVFVTYERVADTPLIAKQLCYLASGGLGGLLAVAVGVMFRVEADFRDEWHKLDRIELALSEDAGLSPPLVLTDADHDPPERPAHRPRRALTTGVAGLLLSVALLAVGYERAADTGDVNRAFEGLVIGIVGLLVASLIVGSYHVTNRRWLGRRKSRLLGRWVSLVPARSEMPTLAADGTVAVVPGGTRYHLRGCPSLAAVRATFLPRTKVDDDLRPCQICGAR